MLATASWDQTLALVRVRDGKLMARLRGHQNEIWDVSPAADENYFFSASKDGTIKKWRWTPLEEPSIRFGSNEVVIPSIRPGDRLLTLDLDKQLFSTWTGLNRNSWTVPGSLVSAVAMAGNNSPQPGLYHVDAKRLLVLNDGTGLAIYRTDDGALEQRVAVPVQTKPYWYWSVSPDLHWLAQVVRGAEAKDAPALRVWDLRIPQMKHAFKAVSGLTWTYGRQFAFSPDSKLLAFPNEDHDIVLWNLSADREERTLKGAVWHLNRVCFSPNGELLAAGGWEGLVYFWNTLDGRLAVPPMHGHGSGVIEVCFSQDGRTLLSSGDDNTVRFWSAASGLEMLRLDRSFSWQALWANDSLLQRMDNRGVQGTSTLEPVASFEEIRAAELREPLVTGR